MASEATPTKLAPLRIGAALAILAAIAFGVWFFLIRDDDSGNGNAPVPKAASVAQLQALPAQVGHSVYWVGTRQGTTYEQTENARGDIFIRYLPAGVPIGDQRPNYLTVGTYPFPNAYNALRRLARREGASSGRLPNRGIYVIGRDRPNSVYVAYRGEDVQVEVFAPSASRARQLVTSGRVQPIG